MVLAKNLVTPHEVKHQLQRHIAIAVEDRHSEFYVQAVGLQELCQGDVFRVRRSLKKKMGADFVLLVSNTCDMQRDREEKILVIPLQRLPHPDEVTPREKDRMRSLYKTVTEYENTRYFYLPPTPDVGQDKGLPGLFGAFGDIVAIPSEQLNDLFESKPADRVLTLKESGFYIFLIKLSVFFLRPDDRFNIAS